MRLKISLIGVVVLLMFCAVVTFTYGSRTAHAACSLSECAAVTGNVYNCYVFSGCRNPPLEQIMAPVKILEKLPGGGPGTVDIDTRTPQQTFMNYVAQSIQWVVWVCIGIGTLWVVICGGMIAAYGGNSGKRAEWVSRIISAIIGIVLLFATSGILRFLNNIFFKI